MEVEPAATMDGLGTGKLQQRVMGTGAAQRDGRAGDSDARQREGAAWGRGRLAGDKGHTGGRSTPWTPSSIAPQPPQCPMEAVAQGQLRSVRGAPRRSSVFSTPPPDPDGQHLPAGPKRSPGPQLLHLPAPL